ncbi:MAG: OsmC family protein [Bacteroidetes bacterium]|nr:OsmC family protein [Bacteroidota bacterium]
MDKISAHIGKENYRVEIKTPSGNVVVSDEPIDKGGKNLGPSPNELLAASLAACTSITVRMYADRKGWELQTLDTDVEIERDEAAKKTIITRKIKLTGNLTEEQRTRILAIANACPVHKILTGPIVIDTKLI